MLIAIGNSNCYNGAMKDPLLDFPGYSLRRAASAVMGELIARLEPLGLRFIDSSAMLLIDANPRITASQLGRMLDIQRANMVPLVSKLENEGWISRTPLDGKSHSLALTELGRVKLSEGSAVIAACEAELIGRVPEQHRAHLKPALDALWRQVRA